ncbi:glycoside hydrolase family 88 protein [Pedobacter sp. HDW13]|uniref:glycoside hydrolase family 88/105 protein n=1 Tax=Pedobacter sp. HDW13 TaxID=2714940 RepID=UPI001409C797|nr:glycoside hydrolase family 88 protein [Pedobacter sp. HDW13]QIL38343.1 glycoside hydrolase family 88 protein [Pedobacter sp. HDW13]
MNLNIIKNKVSCSLFAILLLIGFNSTAQDSVDSIFRSMNRVNDWQWKEIDKKGWKTAKTDWTYGVMLAGMTEFARLSGWNNYHKIISACEEMNWSTGKERLFADDYCIAQTYIDCYNLLGNYDFIKDFKKQSDSILSVSHDRSLTWQNEIYLKEWAWCDALFMGPPSLAYLSRSLDDPRYLKKAAELWWKTSDHLYDPKERLFYRDSRYFEKKEKNGQKVFWSRGNGWVLAGLARFMTAMPKNFPDRDRFIKQFREMAKRVSELQLSDGSWRASLLDPQNYNSKETSGTALYCFALAWGINEGILERKEYLPKIEKAWNCLVSCIHPDGKLGYVQAQGADPQQVGPEDTDVFGTGAFLLAGCEMFKVKFNGN